VEDANDFAAVVDDRDPPGEELSGSGPCPAGVLDADESDP
jgi:hypothetical protein